MRKSLFFAAFAVVTIAAAPAFSKGLKLGLGLDLTGFAVSSGSSEPAGAIVNPDNSAAIVNPDSSDYIVNPDT